MQLKKYFNLFILILLLLSINTQTFSQDNNDDTNTNDSTENNAATKDDDFLEEKGPQFKLTGQYKNLFIFQQTDNYLGDKRYIQYNFIRNRDKNLVTDLQRIRLTPEFKYTDNFIIHIDYDNELILSNYNKSMEFDSYWRTPGYNDLINMTWEPAYNRHVYYRTKVHKAYAKMVFNDITLTLGRQQIRFGSGKLWNPLDILNPISPTFIEGPEEQKGTDAVRLDYYFNEKTELSLVYDQKRNNNDFSNIKIKNSNSVARFKTSIFETEIAVLGGLISHRLVGGIDIATILFEGMLRGSIIYLRPQKGDPYIQGNIGYEYTLKNDTFKNGLSILVEYFYNQNAVNYNRDLKITYTTSLITGIRQFNYYKLSNQFITYNQHYAGLALGYDILSLLRGELFTIWDFQGKGLFLSPSLKYNVLQNMDITIGVLFGHIFSRNKSSDFAMLHKQYMYSVSLSYYF